MTFSRAFRSKAVPPTGADSSLFDGPFGSSSLQDSDGYGPSTRLGVLDARDQRLGERARELLPIRYPIHLEQRGYARATINAGILSSELAAGIRHVKRAADRRSAAETG